MKVCCKTKDKKVNDLEQKMFDLNILICNSIGDNDVVERLKDLKLKLASGENIEIEAKIEKISTIKEKIKILQEKWKN